MVNDEVLKLVQSAIRCINNESGFLGDGDAVDELTKALILLEQQKIESNQNNDKFLSIIRECMRYDWELCDEDDRLSILKEELSKQFSPDQVKKLLESFVSKN